MSTHHRPTLHTLAGRVVAPAAALTAVVETQGSSPGSNSWSNLGHGCKEPNRLLANFPQEA